MAPYPETALLLQLKDIIPNMLNAVYILHLHIVTFYLEETLLVLQILHNYNYNSDTYHTCTTILKN